MQRSCLGVTPCAKGPLAGRPIPGFLGAAPPAPEGLRHPPAPWADSSSAPQGAYPGWYRRPPLVQDVGVDLGDHGCLGMAGIPLGGLDVTVIEFQLVGGAAVPLWYNKDKSENPCGATG